MTSPFSLHAEQSGWIARIRAGDESAFESLFRAFAPGLCVFVGGYVGSREVAEELVQDVFLSMWRRRETLDIEGSIAAYLTVAARNRAFDWLKRERTARRNLSFSRYAADESDTRSPSENDLLNALDLQDAIAQLPPRCRLIFSLSRQQDMSHAEIASSLGISIKTVEVQIGRALKAIRLRLRKYG